MSQYRKIFSVWCFIPSFFYPDASFSFSNECRAQNRFSMKYILSDSWNTMSAVGDLFFFPKSFNKEWHLSSCFNFNNSNTTAQYLGCSRARNLEPLDILKVRYWQNHLSCLPNDQLHWRWIKSSIYSVIDIFEEVFVLHCQEH